MVPPCRPFTIFTHYIGNVVQELTYQHYIVTCLFKQWIDFHTLSGEDYFANRLWFYTNAKHSCGFFLFFLSNTYVLRNSVYEICSDSMNIYSRTLIWTTNPWAEETTVLAASPNRDENENTSRRNRWALSTIDLYKSSLSKQMHCIAFFAQVGTNLTDLTLRKRRVTVRELGGCMGPIWPSYFRDCTSVIVSVVYCENDTSGHRMEISDVTAVSAISVHNLLTLHTVKMTFTCCTIRSIPHWNTNIPHIRTFQNASVVMTLCFCLQFMVDSANIAQISSSCIQLLCVLSAAPLRSASVLLLFNKRSDWPFFFLNEHCAFQVTVISTGRIKNKSILPD